MHEAAAASQLEREPVRAESGAHDADHGRVVEQGTFDELNRSDSALKELLAAE